MRPILANKTVARIPAAALDSASGVKEAKITQL